MKGDQILQSMKAAATATGIPVEVLQKAKELLCPAFEGSRVNVTVLKKWIAEHEEELKEHGPQLSLKETKLNEEIRKLRIRNDRDENLVVRRSEVIGAIRGTIEGVLKVLEQKLINEYPSAVAGLDIAGVRIKGRELHDDILKEWQALSDIWDI